MSAALFRGVERRRIASERVRVGVIRKFGGRFPRLGENAFRLKTPSVGRFDRLSGLFPSRSDIEGFRLSTALLPIFRLDEIRRGNVVRGGTEPVDEYRLPSGDRRNRRVDDPVNLAVRIRRFERLPFDAPRHERNGIGDFDARSIDDHASQERRILEDDVFQLRNLQRGHGKGVLDADPIIRLTFFRFGYTSRVPNGISVADSRHS